jgi:hypothetical protein
MAKTIDATDGDDTEELDAKIARAELRARYYEAQIRVLEARRKLAELRQAMKDKE